MLLLYIRKQSLESNGVLLGFFFLSKFEHLVLLVDAGCFQPVYASYDFLHTEDADDVQKRPAVAHQAAVLSTGFQSIQKVTKNVGAWQVVT